MGAYLTFLDGVLSFTTLSFDGVQDESWDLPSEISSHPVEKGADVTDNVRVGLTKCQLSIICTNQPHQANSFTTPTLTLTNISTPSPSGQDATGVFAVAADRSAAPDQVTATVWDNQLNFDAALKGVGSLVGGAVGGGLGSVVGTAVGGIASALLAPPGPKKVTFTPQGGLGTARPTGDSFQVQLQAQDTPDDYVARMFSALKTLRDSATLITVHGSKNFQENMVIASVNMHRDASTGTGAEFILQLQEIRFVTTQTVTAPAATVPRAKPPAHKGPQNPTQAPAPLTRSAMRNLALQSVKTGGGMLTGDQAAATGLTPADLASIGAGAL
jgi:hypothetical protein